MSEASLSVLHQIIRLGGVEEPGGNRKRLKVSIQVPMEFGWIERVRLVISTFGQNREYRIEHKENDDTYAKFETVIELEENAVYHYYFAYECNGYTRFVKKHNKTGENSITRSECFKLAVGFETPEWAKGAIMYHIFVDRFAKDDTVKIVPMKRRTINRWTDPPVVGANENGDWNVDFYCGNIKGIINALDYIQSLRVKILYLSPLMLSQSNHRYDTADYRKVDPYAGTNEDLAELCKKAHEKGMKVVLDAVFNHTGDDSIYFNRYGTYDEVGAYQSKESPYYKFYKRKWENGKEDFSFWWGMLNLPECNSGSLEWVEYITGTKGIIDQWFALGIDGLRLDVADELSDWFIEKIHEAVRRNKKDGLIIGEVWKNPMRMNRGYLSSGKGMDTVMNYLFVDALVRYYKYKDTNKLAEKIDEIFSEYPEDTIHLLMNFTSTHDISRAIEIFGRDCFTQNGEWGWNLIDESHEWIRNHPITKEEYEHGKYLYKSFVTAMAFFPGMLSIFYGDEAGLTGIGNLANRGAYPWGKEDLELLEFFRTVLSARVDNDFLRYADCNVLKIDQEQFAYERVSDDRRFIVVVSRSHHESLVTIDAGYDVKDIIFKVGASDEKKLAPYGAVVLEVTDKKREEESGLE